MKRKVGSLAINGTPHDIFRGDNVIGRDELSDIVIRSSAISSRHAVIEVEDCDAPLLYDCGSTNKTRLGKMILKPQVRYMLKGDDEIMFADLKAKYTKLDMPQGASVTYEDSGSETGSESMLNMEDMNLDDEADQSRDVLLFSRPLKSGSPSISKNSTSSEINDSSIFEERKEMTNTNIGVVEASSDESTDDEDLFIPPSQTVKEFKTKKLEDKAVSNKEANLNFTEDIFDPDTVSKYNTVNSYNKKAIAQNSENIFEMETQEPNADAPYHFGNKPCNKRDIIANTQSIFNTEAQYLVKDNVVGVTNDPIFEVETQAVVLHELKEKNTETHSPVKDNKEHHDMHAPNNKQISRISEDVFNVETEVQCEEKENHQESNKGYNKAENIDNNKMVNVYVENEPMNQPRAKDDLEMSELILSRALTDIDPSSQVAILSQKNVKDISEELTQVNTFSTHKEIKSNRSNLQTVAAIEKTVTTVNEIEKNKDIMTKTNFQNNNKMSETESSIYNELTQVNTKLPVIKNYDEIVHDASSTDCSPPPSPNALTQVNTKLEGSLCMDKVGKMSRENIIKDISTGYEESDNEALTGEEMEFIAAQETQLNINLFTEVKQPKEVKIMPNKSTTITDMENDATQPNLNLDSFFRENKTNDNISELETEPCRILKVTRTSRTEDSDSTDVEDNVDKNKIKLISTLKNKSPKNNINLKSRNKYLLDESSNESDSLLATIPLDIDLKTVELHLPFTKEIRKEQISDKNINSEKNIKQNENTTNKYPVSDKDTPVKSILTVADMSLCSIVGGGHHPSMLSQCDSTQKAEPSGREVESSSAHSSSKPYNSLFKSSSKKVLDHMSPIVEENINKIHVKPKSLFKDKQQSDHVMNQSKYLPDPCSSSTPFRLEKIISSELKTPPKMFPIKSQELSPLLPSTEELVEVADKTPDCNYESRSELARKQKEMLPLALKRTPRVKKLSRKMAERLEKEEVPPESKINANKIKAGLSPLRKDSTMKKSKTLEQFDSCIDEHFEKSQIMEKATDISIHYQIKPLTVSLERNDVTVSNIEVKNASEKTNNKSKIKQSMGSTENTTHNIDTVNPESDNSKRQTRTKVRKTKSEISSIKKENDLPYEKNPIKRRDRLKKIISTEVRDENGASITSNENLIKRKTRHQSNISNAINQPPSKIQERNDVMSPQKSNPQKEIKKDLKDCLSKKSPVSENESGKKKDNSSDKKSVEGNLSGLSNVAKNKKIYKSPTKVQEINVIEPNIKEGGAVINLDNAQKSQIISMNSIKSDSTERTPVKRSERNKNKVFTEQDEVKVVRNNLSSKTNDNTFKIKSREYHNVERGGKDELVAKEEIALTSSESKPQLKCIEPIINCSIKKTPNMKNKQMSPKNYEGKSETANVCNESNENVVTRKTRKCQIPNEDKKGIPHEKVLQIIEESVQQENIPENKPLDTFQCNPGTVKRGRPKKGIKEDKVPKEGVKIHKIEVGVEKRSPEVHEVKIKRKLKDNSEAECKGGKISKLSNYHEEKKDDMHNKNINEPLMSNKFSKDHSVSLKPKTKRKLNENISEVEEITNAKSVKLSNDNRSNELSQSNHVEQKLKKESRKVSSRNKIKPARFQNEETTYDSSTSDKSSTSKGNSKAKTMESIDSLPFENEKINSSDFAVPVPSKSKPQNKTMQKELAITNVKVPHRSRSKTKQQNAIENPASKSCSRSSSMSSQSSFISDTASIPSPRRSIKTGEKVLFTGLSNPTLESHIKKLGGVVVDSPGDCTVLITDKVRRTVKFLCAFAQGKPIVTPEWVVRSWHCTRFEDPMNHLLIDKESEQRFKFCLAASLRQARAQPLLRGYSVYSTPNVKPPVEDIRSIVISAGGQYLEKVPSRWPPQTIVISHPDDRGLWKKLTVRGVSPPIVQAEMLLLGILQHCVDLETHRII